MQTFTYIEAAESEKFNRQEATKDYSSLAQIDNFNPGIVIRNNPVQQNLERSKIWWYLVAK